MVRGACEPETEVFGRTVDLVPEARLERHATLRSGGLVEDANSLLQDCFVQRRAAVRHE